ncbi:putative MFS family arabinose efflux permease [Chitinophaga niastensis]|uniref:Putative MFS family arabinose efflux permease n=1 Tax=Chitinophaga niastensis TaxID=536980 RepID=A0A2P8HJK7_CHINA|nr:MFS transporter [Chitinophaga niastensis]PSL46406.1 putative MFS family arabinose efflux permease [Chitinophaga niastensis]
MIGEIITKEEKQVPTSLSSSTALLFAIACGLAVANIYYAQPLLNTMGAEIGIRPGSVGIIVTVTQIGYALGLLLLVPLGDLLNRRKLIITQLLLVVAALLVVALASSHTILFTGIAAVGLLAVVTQVLVAYAAALAAPTERGRIVGLVTSGVVLGILLARTVSGTLADLAGWRSVYLFSATLMLLTAVILSRVLPREDHQKATATYAQLLASVFLLFVQERVLRIRAIIAMFIFASFSVLWTSLVLPLSAPPYSFSHTITGLFGLIGVAGALGAAKAGRLADRGRGQWTTGIALTLLLFSWLPLSFTAHSLLSLIAGIIILDFAVQAVHVTNQSMIYSVRPESRNRLVAEYMLFYSVGSGAGSIAATTVYAWSGWTGVCVLGASISALGLIFWALTIRYIPRNI